MTKQSISLFNLFAAGALTLTACAGNAPAPETEPTSTASNVPQQEQSAEKEAPVSEQSKQADNAALFNSQALDSYRLATPENIPAATSSPAKESSASTVAPDPYVAVPLMINNIFTHADSLYKAGNTDSATAYLERFRVIKPLWTQWEAKADSMLNEFGKTRAEKAKEFESLIREIENMNRAKAAYSMVAEAADSLTALAPGDSLVRWAKTQKETAYKNTLVKAQKEYAAIKALADEQAQFAEAEKQATVFQMRYRDFEETLHIQALIDHIKELASATDETATKYWEKNDPAQALAKADSLIQNEKFAAAKEILNKLKFSKLRKEAVEKYNKLAETFCTKQRTITSQLFGKAQKQKDAAKKKKLLQDAIAPLEKCLTEYPDNPQKQKVLENKQFLENEINR
jgi:hypothetical protein